VTGLAAALVAMLGGDADAVARLSASVVLGQLSVGWSNDAHDAADDEAAGRNNKPVVRGLVSERTLWVAAWAALLTSSVLSFVLLGAVAGGWHMAAVVAAWAYNLGLKDTLFSAVPYALAFAALPVVASTVANPDSGVSGALVAVSTLVGVAAHLANTAPDVDSDVAVGRGGLAVRLGSAWSRALAVLLLAIAAVIGAHLLGGGAVVVALLTALVMLAAVAAVVRSGTLFFPAVLAAAGAGVMVALLLG
jgi:4-hydroxybenzoate polyprenyltransferase